MRSLVGSEEPFYQEEEMPDQPKRLNRKRSLYWGKLRARLLVLLGL
jgi:hypothetical protein